MKPGSGIPPWSHLAAGVALDENVLRLQVCMDQVKLVDVPLTQALTPLSPNALMRHLLRSDTRSLEARGEGTLKPQGLVSRSCR